MNILVVHRTENPENCTRINQVNNPVPCQRLFKNKIFALHLSVEETFCPENYTLYDGRCFGVHDNKLNFADAESECNKMSGGHLTAMYSNEELTFLK